MEPAPPPPEADSASDVVAALASSRFLSVASRRSLARLAETATLITFPAGTALFNQKDLPTSVFVIHEGRVRVFRREPDGSVEELRTLAPGAIVGELGVLAGHRRTAAAEAIEDTTAWSIERGAFVEIFKSEPAVSIELAKMMAPYLMDDDAVAEDLLFLDLRARVAKRLLSVARGAGSVENPARELKLTDDNVAMMAGGTAEDVRYILSEMETNGLLRTEPGRIHLLDLDHLGSISIGL